VGQAAQARHQPLTELHIVNGLNPELPFSYYTDLLRGFNADPPGIHLNASRQSRLRFFSDLYGNDRHAGTCAS
jgi:aminodeoxyfutalosine synthase